MTVEPATLYIGTSDAGVFKSATGGSTWDAVNAGLPTNRIQALAIDTTDPTATPNPSATTVTTSTATATPELCAGDCDKDGRVTVDEIPTMVNIALGNSSLFSCEAGNSNHDGQVTVDEILAAVSNALGGCLPLLPTATPIRTPTITPTSTQTPSSPCFIDNGDGTARESEICIPKAPQLDGKATLIPMWRTSVGREEM